MKFLRLLLIVELFLCTSVFAGSLKVHSGYAETLSTTQCFTIDASYEGKGWEAGYRFRYPYNDIGARWEVPLPHKVRIISKVHANLSSLSTYNLDSVVAFGQLFVGKNGVWDLSYAFGLQLSQYLSFNPANQFVSFAPDYHLSFCWRFLDNTLGIRASIDSSDLYWYGYYIFNTIFSSGVDWQCTDTINLSLTAKCRTTDLLKENQYVDMVEFAAGLVWRIN